MELSNTPLSPSDVVKMLQAKKLLPTTLTSAELRQINAAILRQASFSAQTISTQLLQRYKDLAVAILQPQVEQRPDRVTAENPLGNTNVGPNFAQARTQISQLLQSMNYQAPAGKEGTIEDLSSFGRIMLKLETDVASNFGAGRFVQQNSDADVVDAYPGLSFERTAVPEGGVEAERDWPERWRAAAEEAGDDDAARVLDETGEMIALKSSGIWQSLGDGAGGYEDTLGNPYDPIAFNTYMRQFEVARERMEELGFLDKGEAAKPAAFDLGSLFKEAA